MSVSPRFGSAGLILRLLDHQIQGPGNEMLGKVDDVELQLEDNQLSATALLIGPGALGPRLPGRLGSWTTDVWRRLSPERHPHPIRLPLSVVQDIGASVVVTQVGADLLSRQFGLETWLLQHLVGRIPGAGERELPPPSRDAPDLSGAAPGVPVLTLSQLSSFRVVGANGTLVGVVHEIAGESLHRPGVVSSIRVDRLLVGRREVGSMLGYSHERDQGPAAVAALVRRFHRQDRELMWSRLAGIDVAHRRLVLQQD